MRVVRCQGLYGFASGATTRRAKCPAQRRPAAPLALESAGSDGATISEAAPHRSGSFRKLGVPYLGVLIIGTIFGSPIIGNCHLADCEVQVSGSLSVRAS